MSVDFTTCADTAKQSCCDINMEVKRGGRKSSFLFYPIIFSLVNSPLLEVKVTPASSGGFFDATHSLLYPQSNNAIRSVIISVSVILLISKFTIKKSGGPKSSALCTSMLIQQQDYLGNAANVIFTNVAYLTADVGPLLLKR